MPKLGTTKRLGSTAPIVLCGLVMIVAGLGLVVIEAPSSDAAFKLSSSIPAPLVFAARARAQMTKSSPDWVAARAEVLREGPRAGPDAAVRLAYIDIAADRRLGQEGLNALMSSYDEAPLDAGLARFRIPMVLESWPIAPQSLRRQTLAEMAVLWTKFGQRRWLRALPGQLAEPSGRLAATLSLQALEAQKEPRETGGDVGGRP